MLPYEEELVKFLISKSVILRFRKNLRDHKLGIRRKGVKLRMRRLLKSSKPENYIKSFEWRLTKEGKLFWSVVNRKWKETLGVLNENTNTKTNTNNNLIK